MKGATMLYLGRVLMGYCTGVLSYVVSHEKPLVNSQYAPDFGVYFDFPFFRNVLFNYYCLAMH